ncbi:hypothetical protein [Nostoc piscinale]|uniref:hypothetical protein n=1 Tax=Nostoc piscinale TaxID=224012 RepID=UPI0039A72A9F
MKATVYTQVLKSYLSFGFVILAFGFAIALKTCHCEEERRRHEVASRRVAIAKTTGLCDYFAPLSLRS